MQSWAKAIHAELANSAEFGSAKLPVLSKETNNRLMEKLAKHPQFERMCALDCFPRNFGLSAEPKKSFRTQVDTGLKKRGYN